jgi:hypothetical protein
MVDVSAKGRDEPVVKTRAFGNIKDLSLWSQ